MKFRAQKRCKSMDKTDVLSEGSSEWYEKKINELQDWLLDEKIIPEDIPLIKTAYITVLHKVIDMFTGVNTDYAKLVEEMDEWM